MHADWLQQLTIDFLHHRQHGLLDFNHVGAGFPAHRQAKCRLAAGIVLAANFRMIEADFGNIAEAHKAAIALGHDQLTQRFEIVKATHGAHQVTAVAAVDVAGRHIAIALTYRRAQLAQADIALGQLCRRHPDLHLALGAAADADLRDAWHALHSGADIVVDVVTQQINVDLFGVAGQWQDRKIHERIGRKRAGLQARLIDVFRIARDLTEGIADPDQRLVDVHPKRELKIDAGRAGAGRGNHSPQVGHRAQIGFLLDQDFLFHILRGGARPTGFHRDGAYFQIGNHLHRNAQGGDQTEHANDQRGDRGQNAVTQNGLEHGA